MEQEVLGAGEGVTSVVVCVVESRGETGDPILP